MRWQNPWAWLGLLTLVLPVLVHLFSKRQTRVEPFPTLRFIDVSRLLPTRRTQLTDLLLLMVRLLVLATAVAALAQPLWGNRAHASSDATATAVIVDTGATGGDTAGDSAAYALARASLDESLRGVLAASTSQMRIDTDSPVDALAGATAWLATQHGQRQLVIASDFRDGTIDSLDLAQLPRDIMLRLVPRSAVARSASGPVTTNGVVWWATAGASSTDVRMAVTSTVRALGAVALADSLPAGVPRTIVVATPDADSLAAWLRDARPLGLAWMGDVIVRLRADTTLVSASAGIDLTDTTIASPFTVIARSAANLPVVAAAAIGTTESGSAPRLLLWTRTSADALVTAALLLGASRALEPPVPATSGRTIPDSAQLHRWERVPSAPPTVAASVRSSDALTGPSHARWLWLAVLAWLAIETVLRRQSRVKSTAAAADQRQS